MSRAIKALGTSDAAKELAEARRLLGATEVKLGVIPPWLRKLARASAKKQGPATTHPEIILTEMAVVRGVTWLDHWGTAPGSLYACCRKTMNFISEPYDFGPESARALDAFCASMGGLEWHVSSDTWWFPGSTVRITIHPKEKS